MSRLRVKNWADFQHYKDRSPPWIKLHKSLLDDYEYQCLPLASKALAPMLWLLASESQDGSIEYNIKKIAFRLRVSDKEVSDAVKALLSTGFLYEEGAENKPASNALAERSQDACLETEAEREAEKETEQASPSTLSLQDLIAEGVNKQHASDWLKVRKAKKAPLTQTAWSGLKSEALKAGISAAKAVEICALRNWQSFNHSWEWRQNAPESSGLDFGRAI